MNAQEILKFCLENGLLLDGDILKLFSEISDTNSIKLIIEKIKNQTHERVITKSFFLENKELERAFQTLPNENQKSLETLKIKLGLSIEISHEKTPEVVEQKEEKESLVKVLSKIPIFTAKPEVSNFVKYFRNRYNELKNILQNNSKLTNLVSINKISKSRQNFSIIGIVSDKRTTKNKNILMEVEDLGGKIKVLINGNKEELYKEAEEIALDSVIGIKGSGDNNIIFANEVIFPEAMIHERKRSLVSESALFLGDLHFGSKLFLENSFLRLIDYINGKTDPQNLRESEKIKYLFLVGDIIAGIGVYPNQERDLKIVNLEEQFSKLSETLNKIRKDVTIIISPGDHDGVRLMEPQPLLDEKYAWPLYDLKNVILTGNPAYVNIGERKGFSGFDVLTYHGFSYPYYGDSIPRLIQAGALNAPDKIMGYLLKNRHLAPSHKSVQYFPFDEDYMMIKKIPDIFVSAHSHRSAVSYYNNILLISTSAWEAKTAYQEKRGNKPDFCKVPMFNLKTREVRILDFEDEDTKLT